ncbi:uncharacterized protein LOC128959796 [Oppia nitens]|uniref:uncharacterized protein LOC128959796 n=1 Tax=Oppia nitens TaxID=1686743 RepID=UPI0023DCA2B6|nr:uncharacterized protein LOC128959796 [Oppia nitens]
MKYLYSALVLLIICELTCGQQQGGSSGGGQQSGGGNMRRVGQAAWGVAKTAAKMTPPGQAFMTAKGAYDGVRKVMGSGSGGGGGGSGGAGGRGSGGGRNSNRN